jgi:type III secretion protein R
MDLSSFTPASALVTVILLALAPFVAVMVTSFTKLVVVLSLLRNAMGLQQVPPNVVMNGLALILSIYVMYPVGVEMQDRLTAAPTVASAKASSASTSQMLTAADVAKEPLREFLLKHSRPLERAFFLKTAQRSLKPEQAKELSERDFLVIVPAFTVSELTVAFEIGFLIFLPFLVVDLVISNILMAMGMQMLSPTTVSLPFKLLLFVLIDGWVKLTHGLVLTYQT